MKIAILGTRGIPNHYGGFEQYAELLSVFLAAQGWDVTVYNSHNHPYQQIEYKGVHIVPVYDPEKKLGTIGQFFYDLGCILNTRKQGFDMVYQLGYTSSAVFNFLFPWHTTIITNMDGMEWKRSKYNKYVQRFLMWSEKVAVKYSDFLVADSLGIKEYLDKKYKTNAYYSAYTADIPAEYSSHFLDQYNLKKQQYNLVVARLEPENNIDAILEAHTLNNYNFPLIIIGNQKTKYGELLVKKYNRYKHIRFIGGVYNKPALDSIRHYAHMYFHGHSVGGTNPSLLEAMACECSIIAHSNVFNKSILQSNAWYFDSPDTLYQHLITFDNEAEIHKKNKIANLIKIKTIFSEQQIFNSLKEKLIEWQTQKAK